MCNSRGPSIFRYPGGKSKTSIRKKIISKFPKKFSEFRSPFVGGGGIFFSIPKDKHRWINDIYPELIEVYKALANRPDDFIHKCRSIDPVRDDEYNYYKDEYGQTHYNPRLKKVFDEFKANVSMDAALRYYFINRTVWAGRVTYHLPSRLYFSNPQGWNIVKTNKLEESANLLKDTMISNCDYTELLLAPSSFCNPEDVLIYLDPPYIVNSYFAHTSQLYANNFTLRDHIKMRNLIKDSPFKVIISYDDDDRGWVRRLYNSDEFYIHDEQWTYCGSYNSVNNKKKVGNELIITNYPVVDEKKVDIFAYQ